MGSERGAVVQGIDNRYWQWEGPKRKVAIFKKEDAL